MRNIFTIEMRYDILKLYNNVWQRIRLEKAGERMAHHGGNTEQLAREYLKEGKETFFENRLEEAALLVQNALHLFQKIPDYEQYVRALNLMGVIYAATGNETMAVDCYLEGLECAQEHRFEHLLPLFYNNIGARYQELGEHEKAIAYFDLAAGELDGPAACREESHDVWYLVTYMNLATSYCQREDYENASRCLERVEPYMDQEGAATYRDSFLILKSQLYWAIGKKEFVYEHLTQLLESSAKDSNAPDYVQDIRNLCALFRQMGEYDHWEKVIWDFERFVSEQDNVYFRLTQTELWMEYYQTIGEMKKYIHLCVEHTELYRRQKTIADRERAAAIDMKIELKKKEAERRRVEELSTTDVLTGLGNRYLIEQNAKHILENMSGNPERIAVGILDVDCFKQHNDTYGHIHGDECLRRIARLLEQAVGQDGSVYRFGGDEFVLFLQNREPAQVEQVARRIKGSIEEEGIENVNSTVLPVITVSQGYSCFVPTKEENVDDLIDHADKALYYVKKHGRNGYHVIVE